MKRPTLADVARRCEVSTMTVSRVVRGFRNVSEKTALRIRAAIEELGYTPDPALQSLAQYRVQTNRPGLFRSKIAFLDCDGSHFSKNIFSKAEKEARRLGYQIELYAWPAEEAERKKLSRKLHYEGIRGILIGPAQRDERLHGIQTGLFAMVSIGALQHSPPIDSVSKDYFQELYLAGQQCLGHGYRNIALFLAESIEALTDHGWLGAYYALCHRGGIVPRVWLYGKDSRPGIDAFREWIAREKIDCVLTLCDDIHSTHLRRKDSDVRYVFLNNWLVPPHCWHIDTSLDMIASQSVRLLNEHLLHQQYGLPEWPRRIYIKGRWRENTEEGEAAAGQGGPHEDQLSGLFFRNR